MNKAAAYDFLTETAGYPERVAIDLCNYFTATQMQEFIDFLKLELGVDDDD